MYETLITVVGNVATDITYKETSAGVPMARFRLAATVRRFDRERGGWADAYTSFYTVWAWRTLAVNLKASVAVGEPLLVHGKLRVHERDQDGRSRVSVDIEAMAVGHDLSRGTSAFRRVSPAKPGLTGLAADAGSAAAGPAPAPLSDASPVGAPVPAPEAVPPPVPGVVPEAAPVFVQQPESGSAPTPAGMP